jgi:hypothetical protein
MTLQDTALIEHLDQLAEFEPTPLPVVSLYLNTEAGPHGKSQFEQFIRKEFPRSRLILLAHRRGRVLTRITHALPPTSRQS